MRLVPQGAVPVEGETVRLEAKLLYTSCDRFLGVTARVDPGTQTIKVSANLLKRPDVDNCLGELELGHDIQVLGTLSPGTWTVSAYYGGGPMFTFEVAPCPAGKDCLCTQTKPDLPFGAECRYHCECSGDNVCVRSFGEGGQPQAECRPSCAVDAQCAPGFTCVRGGDSPDLVCQPTFSGAVAILCEGDADCSKEDSCHTWPNGARSCEPRPDDMDKHASERCECTEQCESLSCVVAEGEDMWWNECRLPCRGQRDCPPGRTCGAGTIWSEPVCS